MIIPLRLTGVWLSSVDGTTLHLVGEVPLPGVTPAVSASVQDYAGRRRIVSTAAHSTTTTFTVWAESPADVAQLEAWQGSLLLLRTPYWRRWGTYVTIPTTPILETLDPDEQVWSAEIAWTDVDYSEAI